MAEEREDHLRAAASWALGQIGRHTPEHAKAVALANVLPKLLEWYLKAESSEDLQQKVCKLFVFFFNIEMSYRIYNYYLFRPKKLLKIYFKNAFIYLL